MSRVLCSFVLVLRSEGALAAVQGGLAAPGGAVRQDWCKSNKDRVRRNLADFHSCSPFPSVSAKWVSMKAGGYEPEENL